PADPDAQELEEIGDGVRLYGREEQRLTVDGRPALVTFRVVKRLVDGRWERAEVREDPDDGPGRASRTGLVRPGDSSHG
ncbi:MAG TPA: hypothetical protein VGA71_05280, partial [Actinomycetota bacterium]